MTKKFGLGRLQGNQLAILSWEGDRTKHILSLSVSLKRICNQTKAGREKTRYTLKGMVYDNSGDAVKKYASIASDLNNILKCKFCGREFAIKKCYCDALIKKGTPRKYCCVSCCAKARSYQVI